MDGRTIPSRATSRRGIDRSVLALLLVLTAMVGSTMGQGFISEFTKRLTAIGSTNDVERLPSPVPQYTLPLANSTPSGEVEFHSEQNGLVTLIVRDAPLGQVVSMIAQSQGLNVVASESINSRLSITLKDVPLDEALESVLSVTGYAWAQHNNILHITPANNAASLPPSVQGRRMQIFHLDYASATDVAEAIRGFLSPVGKAFVSESIPTDNRRSADFIVVEELPAFFPRIESYIAQIDQPPRQVQIEARILEIELDDSQRHGVDFQHLFDIGNNMVTLETSGFSNPLAPQAFFGTISGGNLTTILEALKTTTDAKTLASPKLMVLNGQTARLQVGEQLGFRVVTTTETASLESVQFLDVGVVLTVTPRISRTGRVIMHVKPEISSGQVNPATGLPEEETTEVETDVLLNNGEGMVIGGLIQETDDIVQSKIPWLGDLWLVGKLFQRSETKKRRSEIVIALIPHVVPITAECQAIEHEELERVATPLYFGPLQRMPRPWEPRLPDALCNPLSIDDLKPDCGNYPGQTPTTEYPGYATATNGIPPEAMPTNGNPAGGYRLARLPDQDTAVNLWAPSFGENGVSPRKHLSSPTPIDPHSTTNRPGTWSPFVPPLHDAALDHRPR